MDKNYKLTEKEYLFKKSKLLKFSGGAFAPPHPGMAVFRGILILFH